MKHKYINLIKQNYQFPQEGFDLKNGYLSFNGISLKYLIEKYNTPFKLVYLPRIAKQIKRARNLFNRAIKKNNYKGKYQYCYCTKCCHFSHVVKSALREKVHLETSSSFDIDLIFKLYEEGELSKTTILIHNGYKTEDYLKKILELNRAGFKNSILVLDSKKEIERLKQCTAEFDGILKIGIRIAVDEAPQSAYSTSRLGIRQTEILDFYATAIKDDENLSLKMVHFFVDAGIKDNTYYWGEMQKALKLFVKLKQQCEDIKALNLGGGFPIRNNLGFEYDYEYMIDKIVGNIKEKKQNDIDTWYIINNSLINTIPDAWLILEKFIFLPINKWHNEYTKVNIGGISCDQIDYYNSENLNQQLFLPSYNENEEEPLYVGFFHTGAYQDSISGYGGIKHCLIPTPKLIIIDEDENGNLVDYIYKNEKTVDEMLSILGYN